MSDFAAVNPFTDSGSPWYYVVGAAFLVLIFAALALYIVLSNRRKKKLGESEPQSKDEASADETQTVRPNNIESDSVEAVSGGGEEKENSENYPDYYENEANADAVQTESVQAEAETVVEQEKVEQAPDKQRENEIETKGKGEEKPMIKTSIEKNQKKKAIETEAKTLVKTEKAKKAEKEVEAPTQKPPKQATKQSKPKTQKPFIDRLIADKSAHGAYNAVKNAILSYPGIKAKITKDDEKFMFGEQTKASISLGDGGIELKLAVKPENVPDRKSVV